MIKTPLSTVIGGAFWTPGATVIGGKKPSFNLEILKLFANGEQGFYYDPNDLSTMFQIAAGITRVTSTGQPVGLLLDKSKGGRIGKELYLGGEIQSVVGGSAFTTYSLGVARNTGTLYEVSYSVKNYSGTGVVSISGGTNVFQFSPIGLSGDGTVTQKLLSLSDGSFSLFTQNTNQCVFYNISIREIFGSHAYQTTTSMRPLLVASPQRIDYDTVDDKIVTTLPAQLTGCTVVRSVPNVGTQILTGQTIPATYNDNTDHCGLIVINRALTPSETSVITTEFNKRAGV